MSRRFGRYNGRLGNVIEFMEFLQRVSRVRGDSEPESPERRDRSVSSSPSDRARADSPGSRASPASGTDTMLLSASLPNDSEDLSFSSYLEEAHGDDRPSDRSSDESWWRSDESYVTTYGDAESDERSDAARSRRRSRVVVVDERSDDDEDTTESADQEDGPSSPRGQKRPASPTPLPSKRHASPEDIEAASCPVCLDPWTAAGPHRAVALPCGHVFGRACVRRWLLSSTETRGCPTCKMRCRVQRLRRLRPPLVPSPAAAGLRAELSEVRAGVVVARGVLAKLRGRRARDRSEIEELKKQLEMRESDT